MFLAARVREPKATDHLIQHQQRAVLVADTLDCLQVTGLRVFVLHRFKHDASNPAGVVFESLAKCIEIVIRKSDGQRFNSVRDTSIHRRRADEPVVIRKEWLVVAQRHHVAPGRRSSELDRPACRGRPILCKFDHICTGHRTKYLFRAQQL